MFTTGQSVFWHGINFGRTGSDPIGRTGSDPIGRTGSDPIGRTGSDPIGRTGPAADGRTGSDPIGRTGSDPIGRTGSDPIGRTGPAADGRYTYKGKQCATIRTWEQTLHVQPSRSVQASMCESARCPGGSGAAARGAGSSSSSSSSSSTSAAAALRQQQQQSMGRRAAALRGRAAAAALTSLLQCAKVSQRPTGRSIYCWKVVLCYSRTVHVSQRGADFRLPSTGLMDSSARS
jgi:hypothetical protein